MQKENVAQYVKLNPRPIKHSEKCLCFLTFHWWPAGHVNNGIQRTEWCRSMLAGGSSERCCCCGKNCTSCRCHRRHMGRDSTRTATLTSSADNAAGYREPQSARWGGPRCPTNQNEGSADQCCTLWKKNGKMIADNTICRTLKHTVLTPHHHYTAGDCWLLMYKVKKTGAKWLPPSK